MGLARRLAALVIRTRRLGSSIRRIRDERESRRIGLQRSMRGRLREPDRRVTDPIPPRRMVDIPRHGNDRERQRPGHEPGARIEIRSQCQQRGAGSGWGGIHGV